MSPKVFVLLSALSLAACAGTPQPIGGAPGLQVVQGDLPAPGSADVAPVSEAYRVGPNDTLKIDVFGIPELSGREAVVGPDGRIAFPLVGSIDVAGRTSAEITDLLAARLRAQYVRDPQVTLEVRQAPNRTVVVYGEVQLPGTYPVVGEYTLMEAVATARGFTKYANSRDVVVFRTVNQQKMATLYNLEAISRGAYPDPRIYPNDTVVVGNSKARRLFDDIVGAATLIATPITVLLQNS